MMGSNRYKKLSFGLTGKCFRNLVENSLYFCISVLVYYKLLLSFMFHNILFACDVK